MDQPEQDDFPVLYSQEVLVGTSFHDVSLVFFQDSYKGNRVVANVTLPPAVARQLQESLREALEQYEQDFGPVALPPEELEEDLEESP